jgi:hypothetical protein
MLNLQKVLESEADFILGKFLNSMHFLPIFFYSPYTLNTWLMHQERSLYIASLGEESVLILHKEKNNDIRFLFSEPGELLLEAVSKYFNPRYIAFNDIFVKKEFTEATEDKELTVDIGSIVSLRDGKVRSDYKKCLKRHPDFTIERYQQEDREEVGMFLEEWAHSRSEEKNKFAKIENDNRFIDIYGSREEVLGIVIKDGKRIIAISFACPSQDGQMIGVINKCLRGYTQLGMFVFMERAKLVHSFGFDKLYLGSINNDFKKKFITSGNLEKTFSREVFREEGFITQGSYLTRLF